ncbi:MAG: hypothetical protein ABEN55_12565 [Bradymonadaceae bacterium]
METRQYFFRVSAFLSIVFTVVLTGCGERPRGDDTDYEPYERPDPVTLECAPDTNEKITADELDPALGVEANYLVSPAGKKRRVDLAGEPAGDGERRWDWSQTREDDRSIGIAAESVSDQWYADSFPNGEFVLPIDLSGATEGIYRVTDEVMLLLGIASSKKSPANGKTLLVYNEPVPVYQFPVETGDQWVATGEVDNGTLRGTPYAGRDTYRVKVRAMGEMKLPNLTFEQVHRVDTQVTVEPAAGKSVSRRQVSFVAECFGEVARATSPNGVTKKNFEQAAEVRRLGVR